jgi:hypothetical protein
LVEIASAAASLTLRSTGTSDVSINFQPEGGASSSNQARFRIIADGNSTDHENLRIQNDSAQVLFNLASAGNLVIGNVVTSPEVHLLVTGANSGTFGAGTAGAIRITDTSAGTPELQFSFQNTTKYAAISGIVTDGTSNTRGDIVFSTRELPTDTNLSERMRINGTGFVGIGTTGPATMLHVASATFDGNILRLQDSDGTCDFNPENVAPTISCSSDQRLKSAIVDSEVSVLEYFDGFRIRDFTLRASGDRHTGVIAQELMQVHPELVSSGSMGYLSVQLPNPWLYVKAIQELNARITALQSGSLASGSAESNNLDIWDWRSVMRRVKDLFASMWEITIEKGLIETTRGIFETIDAKNGVTTYDEETGEPYCIKVKGGELISSEGACGVPVDDEDGAQGGADSSPTLMPSSTEAEGMPTEAPMESDATESEGVDSQFTNNNPGDTSDEDVDPPVDAAPQEAQDTPEAGE